MMQSREKYVANCGNSGSFGAWNDTVSVGNQGKTMFKRPSKKNRFAELFALSRFSQITKKQPLFARNTRHTIAALAGIFITINGVYALASDAMGPVHERSQSMALSASVYSDTTLELFWSKSHSPANTVAFELLRNNAFVSLGDVASFMDFNLVPGETYHYVLYAVDADNNKSPVSGTLSVTHNDSCRGAGACVSFSSSSSSSDTQSNFDPVINETTQATSMNALQSSSSSSSSSSADSNSMTSLQGSVYSSSAVELFWQITTDQTVVHFDIYRNGNRVASLNGQSYFDDALSADTAYQYEVVATFNTGSRSLGTVQLRTNSL